MLSLRKKPVDILVISLTSPILVGIYHKNHLLDKYESEQKTTDILPDIFDEILNKYEVKNLFFAKGPGSFMSIKITYIFLQTLAIVLNVPLFATDGFAFNNNSPIKAIGSLYFIKENGNITPRKIDTKIRKIMPFALPEHLETEIFSKDTKPLYVLPAV